MSDGDLVLGPLLRHVDETTAAIWVEVGRRGTVSVSAGDRVFEAHTFTVHGHHYALVEVDGLPSGSTTPYAVRLDGRQVWPHPHSAYPPSVIRTLHRSRRTRVMFGSCRTSVPHDREHNRSHGIDVLRAYALSLPRREHAEWPDLVMFLGDQVYADETSDEMREFIAARRDIDQPPYEELKDYEEYAHLYRLAWTDPANRWLLSTVPSAMIFDDHDIRDDWNTSRAWREEINRLPWWRDRIVGGLASYWVYQHLGNLGPAERAEDKVWAELREVGRDGDAGAVLDDFVARVDRDPSLARWSYARDIGTSRFIVLDTRCGRMLDEGDRRILGDEEQEWLESLATGDVDHLVIGTSLPFLLPIGLHHLEAWNEAVTAGAWGSGAARLAEKVRQGVDLEHWAAFQKSFQRVAAVLTAVARGERGSPPATVCLLSGDVHHSYIADAHPLPRRRRSARRPTAEPGGWQSRVVQVVCSPIRNPLPRAIRLATAVSAYGLAWPMGLLAARSAKVPDPPLRWSLSAGPWFENAVATLDIDGRRARVTFHHADVGDDHSDPVLSVLRTATLS
jgi:hypothetical protein